MLEKQLFYYKAKVLRVLDGDTFEALLEIGFGIKMQMTFRLLGLDTPELHAKEKEVVVRALNAKAFTEEKIGGKEVIVRTEHHDSFGRYLAEVFVNDESLNALLLKEGHARPMQGKKRL